MKKRKPKRKSVLGGKLYVIVHDEQDGSCDVHKLNSSGSEIETYVVDADGACNCQAGDMGRDCKHLKMAANELVGAPLPMDPCVEIVEGWLLRLNDQVSDSRGAIVGEAKYGSSPTIQRVDVLVCGLKAHNNGVLYTEQQGVLIRAELFRTEEQFLKRLSETREERRGQP
jgi:hypothetical protein